MKCVLNTRDFNHGTKECSDKEGRWAGAVGKRHVCLSSAGAQGASNFFFF
ncbi:hypothetical protein P9597_15600 [Aneurinibacillus migulanus]|nr:hypothetical protein [Aneurinibacillus migulanus]